MWRALTEARGVAGRDEVWSHPDLLPTTEDLDDPEGFAHGRPELDLSDLTDPDSGDPDSGGPDSGGPGSGGPGEAEPGGGGDSGGEPH